MGGEQSQTNAPLFYAQYLMSMHEKVSVASKQQDQYALLTSTWLCLKESWCCWLNELSSYMNLDRTESDQSHDLKYLLSTGLPEGQLLAGLLESSESWLSILLQRTAKPTERLKPKVSERGTSNNLISLVSMDDMDESDLVEHVLTEFKKYIESVRLRQVEW